MPILYKASDVCGNCRIDIFRKAKCLQYDRGVSTIIASFVIPAPHQLARRHHLWALLLAHGYPFRNLTYFFGCRAGNTDDQTDIIDAIIAYL